jgi:hypothetical protein
LARRGRDRGAVTWENMLRTAAQGMLKPDDLIWTDGMSEWKAVADMPDLVAVMPKKKSKPLAKPAAPATASSDPDEDFEVLPDEE